MFSLKPRIFFVLLIFAFLLNTCQALTVNISYGAANTETLFVGIGAVPRLIFIVDTSLPIVGTIFFDNFIITENGFIDGTGTIHAIVYDGSGISSCEYKYINAWYPGNYDGSYCTSEIGRASCRERV